MKKLWIILAISFIMTCTPTHAAEKAPGKALEIEYLDIAGEPLTYKIVFGDFVGGVLAWLDRTTTWLVTGEDIHIDNERDPSIAFARIAEETKYSGT